MVGFVSRLFSRPTSSSTISMAGSSSDRVGKSPSNVRHRAAKSSPSGRNLGHRPVVGTFIAYIERCIRRFSGSHAARVPDRLEARTRPRTTCFSGHGSAARCTTLCTAQCVPARWEFLGGSNHKSNRRNWDRSLRWIGGDSTILSSYPSSDGFNGRCVCSTDPLCGSLGAFQRYP
jgi:hypothetical protein